MSIEFVVEVHHFLPETDKSVHALGAIPFVAHAEDGASLGNDGRLWVPESALQELSATPTSD